MIYVNTLDNFCKSEEIESIDILKTDTEGYDLEVLKGAENLLNNNAIKFVLAEVGFNKNDIQHTYFHDIYAYLNDKGFKVLGFLDLYDQNAIYNIDQNSFGLGYCNCLFINTKSFVKQ
jgi:hypothetical protein